SPRSPLSLGKSKRPSSMKAACPDLGSGSSASWKGRSRLDQGVASPLEPLSGAEVDPRRCSYHERMRPLARQRGMPRNDSAAQEASFMTITLSPETEARLRERAERDGEDVSSLAEALLSDALAEDPDDLSPEQIAEVRAGIRRGLEAAAEGRERSVAAY